MPVQLEISKNKTFKTVSTVFFISKQPGDTCNVATIVLSQSYHHLSNLQKIIIQKILAHMVVRF